MCLSRSLKPLGQLMPNLTSTGHLSFLIIVNPRGPGLLAIFYQIFGPHGGAFTRALKVEKLKAPLFPGPVGAGDTMTDAFNISLYIYSSSKKNPVTQLCCNHPPNKRKLCSIASKFEILDKIECINMHFACSVCLLRMLRKKLDII